MEEFRKVFQAQGGDILERDLQEDLHQQDLRAEMQQGWGCLPSSARNSGWSHCLRSCPAIWLLQGTGRSLSKQA